MHVGCARWVGAGIEERAWFFPGSDDIQGGNDPVADVYCTLHAKVVATGYAQMHGGTMEKTSAAEDATSRVNAQQQRRNSMSGTSSIRRNSATSTTSTIPSPGTHKKIVSASSLMADGRLPLVRGGSGPTPSESQRLTAPAPLKKLMSASAAARACEAQQAKLRAKLLKKQGGKASDTLGLPPAPSLLSTGKEAKTKKQAKQHANNNVGKTYALHPFARAKDTSRIDKQILDKDSAQAIAKPSRGPLLNEQLKRLKRDSVAEEKSRKTRQKTLKDQVFQDVLDEYLSASSKEARIQCLKGKRNMWKRQLLSEMSAEDFNEKIWVPVREGVREKRIAIRQQKQLGQEQRQDELEDGGISPAGDTVDVTNDEGSTGRSDTGPSDRHRNSNRNGLSKMEFGAPQEDAGNPFAHTDDHLDPEISESSKSIGRVESAQSSEVASAATLAVATSGNQDVYVRGFGVKSWGAHIEKLGLGGEEDHEYSSDQEYKVGDWTKPESRWAHFSVGPLYKNESFQSKWDSSEQI
jgi:hypothetical protein